MFWKKDWKADCIQDSGYTGMILRIVKMKRTIVFRFSLNMFVLMRGKKEFVVLCVFSFICVF